MNYIYFMLGWLVGFASLGLLVNIWADKHYPDKDWEDRRSWW